MSEGDILMAKAEKASSGGFLSKLFNGANNDEVADLYKDAGNAYKTSRSYDRAHVAFKKAAEKFRKADNNVAYLDMLNQACQAALKFSIQTAMIETKELAVQYARAGRHQRSAKLMDDLAKSCLEEYRLDHAVQSFREALKYYEAADNSTMAAGKCKLEIAKIVAKENGVQGRKEAITLIDEEAERMFKSGTLAFNARSLWVDVMILYMANDDVISSKIYLEKKIQTDAGFKRTTDAKSLTALIEAIEAQDPEQFSEVLHEYNECATINDWRIHFLYEVKQKAFPAAVEKDLAAKALQQAKLDFQSGNNPQETTSKQDNYNEEMEFSAVPSFPAPGANFYNNNNNNNNNNTGMTNLNVVASPPSFFNKDTSKIAGAAPLTKAPAPAAAKYDDEEDLDFR